MKFEFYQRSWNGIDLVKIADDLGIPHSTLADSRIYAEFYRRMEQSGFAVPDDWARIKLVTTGFIKGLIDSFAKEKKVDHPKVLSIGAGIGIVEMPLIKEGYDIRLQECDESILRYFEKRSAVDGSVKVENSELSHIPAGSYDIAYSVTVSYALDDDDYVRFLEAQKRIVRSGGVIVVWEFLVDVKCFARHLLKMALGRRQEGIRWGFIRTPGEHLATIKRSGLDLKEVYLMDSSHHVCRVAAVPPRINRFPVGAFVLEVK